MRLAVLTNERLKIVYQRRIQTYIDSNGNDPFNRWLRSLQDKVRSIIDIRLSRIQLGNLGDYAPVGDGVFELRIHYGAGYRVYFAMHGHTILLLGGGDKSSQVKDINRAKAYWKEYQEIQK